jgi:hypothetical protein
MERAISFQIVESPSAAMRLDAAADFLRQFPRHQPITIVAATRGAADDLARRIARERVATFGLARFSLTQLAARIAATRLAGRGIAPSTSLGAEAVSARASFEAANAGALAYFGSVARAPGFPRALANTVADLRLAGITANEVGRAAAVGPDLAHLLSRVEQEFESSNTADRGRLLEAAAESAGDEPFLRAPLLLLDVPGRDARGGAVRTRAHQRCHVGVRDGAVTRYARRTRTRWRWWRTAVAARVEPQRSRPAACASLCRSRAGAPVAGRLTRVLLGTR